MYLQFTNIDAVPISLGLSRSSCSTKHCKPFLLSSLLIFFIVKVSLTVTVSSAWTGVLVRLVITILVASIGWPSYNQVIVGAGRPTIAVHIAAESSPTSTCPPDWNVNTSGFTAIKRKKIHVLCSICSLISSVPKIGHRQIVLTQIRRRSGAASDQGLHCFQKTNEYFSLKWNKIKMLEQDGHEVLNRSSE